MVWIIHFALLRPGTGKDLRYLFMSDMSVSNQSQHAFWSESAISDAPIFVTADFVWGPGRRPLQRTSIHDLYAYVRQPSSLLDEPYYFLEDRYITVRKYDLEPNAEASEWQEILARLQRLKADAAPQNRAPR